MGPLRVRRVVTTRMGGASAPPFDSFNLSANVGDEPGSVAANRRRLAAGIGLPEERVVWMSQVHGTSVATIADLPTGDVEDTDAMVTDRPGVALAVLSADCVPVLLADPLAGVVGVAHAGRVGAASGVLGSVLAAMGRLGARAAHVEALLGPSVCGGCYEVPGRMRDEVAEVLPGSACRTRGGTPGLDLRMGLRTQLQTLGVTRIDADPRCTVEEPTLYSHRGEGRTGRLASLTWLDRR
jgi:YfiH family protein